MKLSLYYFGILFLIIYYLYRHISIVGSVVEFSPATRETGVRFPDNAFCKLNCFSINFCLSRYCMKEGLRRQSDVNLNTFNLPFYYFLLLFTTLFYTSTLTTRSTFINIYNISGADTGCKDRGGTNGVGFKGRGYPPPLLGSIISRQ